MATGERSLLSVLVGSVCVLWLIVATIVATIAATAQSGDQRGLEVKIRQLGEYATAGKQYLVIIGISRYREWMALKNPVQDAKEVRDILIRQYYIDQVLELYDEEATKEGIIKLFGYLIDRVDTDDSVLIFYAGHGHLDPLSGTGFWIPVDGGTNQYAQKNWLPNTQIRGFIGKMRSRHIALIADSCFSGDLLNPIRAKMPDITNEYFKNAYSRISRQVLTSGALETVPDASSFAQQLKLALVGNKRPYVDPLMLYSEIRLGVGVTTPLFGNLTSAGHQEGAAFLLFRKEQQVQRPESMAEPVGRPTVSVNEEYGSLSVSVQENGKLYIDGAYVAEVQAGRSVRIDDLLVGDHQIDIRYDSQTERLTVMVQEDRVTTASFEYKKKDKPKMVF